MIRGKEPELKVPQGWLRKRMQVFLEMSRTCDFKYGHHCEYPMNLTRSCSETTCKKLIGLVPPPEGVKLQQTIPLIKYEKPAWETVKATAGFVKDGILHKYEWNQDAIFRKSGSLSIKADDLEGVDGVRVFIPPLRTVVEARTSDIIEFNETHEYHGEKKYYYPCRLWFVVDGKLEWYRDWGVE